MYDFVSFAYARDECIRLDGDKLAQLRSHYSRATLTPLLPLSFNGRSFATTLL
jgi:hypothetical protein